MAYRTAENAFCFSKKNKYIFKKNKYIFEKN